MRLARGIRFKAASALAVTAVLVLFASPARSSKPSVVEGNVRSVSHEDIRAAIAAAHSLERIRFIHVVDHNRIQLHHESQGDRCEHYDDVRRKRGEWRYRVTVVVVEGCGHVPM